MKHLLARLTALLALSVPALAVPCSAGPAPGFAVLADDPAQDRPLSLSVWYPAEAGTPEVIGGNAVFAGTAAVPEAAVADGPFPLILLSHGGLRSAANSGAWLGGSLASDGFVVVEINAPPPATAQAAVDEIWRRPRDISRALDLLLDDPLWAARIDAERISVAGFALGGTAALTVTGAGIDGAAYLGACSGAAAEGPDCAWFFAQGVDLPTFDPARMGQTERDRRIAAAIAIAPEYVPTLRGKADAAALIITLGGSATPRFPNARHVAIPDAQTADAFALCTNAGPLILREEGEDPALCGAGPTPRAAIHRQITDAIRDFLAEVAGPPGRP